MPNLAGLSQSEAARRLASTGPNEISASSGRSLFAITFETMREPMFLLLIGSAALYLVLGDLGGGLFLMGGALASIGLVIFQEARSEKALAALRDLSQPHARVVRDNMERSVAARDLVPGDIMLVGEGERLSADAVLVAGDVLGVDESALTGESAPVSKRSIHPEENLDSEIQPGAESGPYLFSGTMVVRGQAVAQKTAKARFGSVQRACGSKPASCSSAAKRSGSYLYEFSVCSRSPRWKRRSPPGQLMQ